MVEDTGIICSGRVDWDWQEVCCHWQDSGWWRAIQNFPIASGRGSSFCGFCRFLAFGLCNLAWKIFGNIEKDHAFTTENAEYMGRISFLAAADAVVLLVGNVLFLLIGMNHPGILLLCFVVTLIGIGFSVAAAALSHLIRKAADLQDQSDWTI